MPQSGATSSHGLRILDTRQRAQTTAHALALRTALRSRRIFITVHMRVVDTLVLDGLWLLQAGESTIEALSRSSKCRKRLGGG